MNKINFLALYAGRKCLVTAGPHAGKHMLPVEFHFKENVVVSVTGAIFPVEGVKVVLRRLEDMTETEGHFIYRNYNEGQVLAEDWSGDNGSAYFKPRKVTAGKEHALRLIQGKDYTSPDFELWMAVLPYLLSQGFNIFNDKYKDYFVYEA